MKVPLGWGKARECSQDEQIFHTGAKVKEKA